MNYWRLEQPILKNVVTHVRHSSVFLSKDVNWYCLLAKMGYCLTQTVQSCNQTQIRSAVGEDLETIDKDVAGKISTFWGYSCALGFVYKQMQFGFLATLHKTSITKSMCSEFLAKDRVRNKKKQSKDWLKSFFFSILGPPGLHLALRSVNPLQSTRQCQSLVSIPHVEKVIIS